MKQLRTILVLATIFFVACGDETTQINQTSMNVFATEEDLPVCTQDNENELAWVKGESSVRICSDGTWFATFIEDTLSSGEFKCRSIELVDGSGFSIVCNGDTIGVVLNGKDGTDGEKGDKGKDGEDGEKGDKGDKGIAGENGTDGKDGTKGNDGRNGVNGKNGSDGVNCSITGTTDLTATVTCGDSVFVVELSFSQNKDTVENDSERVATKIRSFEGFAQKGPFVKGSAVYLYELSDGRTLKQTNGNYLNYIMRNDGYYHFSERNLISQYAMIVVEGNYRNENTGKISDKPISLRVITNMSNRDSANINLLTNIEYERVYYLVTHEKKKVAHAKKQALKEIFEAFNMGDIDFDGYAEDLNLFGETDADVALLALSILLQGNFDETGLAVFLTELGNDLETDGEWNDSANRARIADWAIYADSYGEFAGIRTNIGKMGVDQSAIPEFEKYIRNFSSVESGLGICGDADNPPKTVRHVSNPNSTRYYAKDYTDTSISKVRFFCRTDPVPRWFYASNIEKDTANWGDDWEEGTERSGQINTNLGYVFENNHWRAASEMERLLRQGCVENGRISDTLYNDFYYRCEPVNEDISLLEWKKVNDALNDVYEFLSECKADGIYGHGNIVAGRVNKEALYVCDNGEFRLATEREISMNKGCTSYNEGNLLKEGETEFLEYGYLCEGESTIGKYLAVKRDESKYGTVIDSRDGKKYYTINIQNKTWMAENLNFEYKVNGSTYGNICNEDSCRYYGRYYTWAAAMDSAGLYSTDGKGCGSEASCSTPDTVRGICPEGWHLPSNDEIMDLSTALKHEAMQAKGFSKWPNATDESGFTSFPTGYYSVDRWRNYGDISAMWSTAIKSGEDVYALLLKENLLWRTDCEKTELLPIRCVQNKW